jgi:hypothetical protein
MPDILAAVDETAATTVLHAAEAAVGTQSATAGSASFGPVEVSWNPSASFAGGTVTLTAPDTVEIDNLNINYSLGLSIGIDLSFLDFCLPQLCLPTPFGNFCTPKICFDPSPISLSVPFSGTAVLSADFGLSTHLTGGSWFVDVVIQGVPQLDLGTAATALLLAAGTAISAALAAVPFIGPVLSIAAAAITAAFGLAEVTGLLGPIVSLFVSGMTFSLYHHSQVFEVLPASGPVDPAVDVTITALNAVVQSTDKNELVLSADI